MLCVITTAAIFFLSSQVALREQYMITQFPTLILFRHGTDPVTFIGDQHDVKAIAHFLERFVALPFNLLLLHGGPSIPSLIHCIIDFMGDGFQNQKSEKLPRTSN